MAAERVHVLYGGRVQGVGFRYTAVGISRRHHVAGWVRNVPDGRVELLAEGERTELEKFLTAIRAAMEGCIRTETPEWAEATGEFSGFRVAY